MKYLKQAYKRPFTNIRSLTIGSLLEFSTYVVTFLVMLLFLESFLSSLGVSIIDIIKGIEPSQYPTQENISNLLFQNKHNLIIAISIVFTFSWCVYFILTGYFLRCAKTASKKIQKMPKWDNWPELLKNGFILFVISLIYTLVWMPISIILVILSAMILPQISTILLFLSIFLLLYISPMVMAFYSINNKFKDAFRLNKIFKKVFTLKYLGNALLILIFLIVSWIILIGINALLSITIILPAIISAVLYFYLNVLVFTVFGRLYSEIKR